MLYHVILIFLHQQVNTEHEDVEAEQRDDEPDDHDDGHDKSEEVGGLLALQLLALHFIAVVVEKLLEVLACRIVHLHDETVGYCVLFGCIALVRPLEEALRNKNAVHSAGETDDAALEIVAQAVAVDVYPEVDHAERGLSYSRQVVALCISEVVHAQVRPWQHDGHLARAFAVGPVAQWYVDEGVGHALEGEFRV